MSIDFSSNLSSPRNIDVTPQKPRPIVCGLLGTTSASDHWMETDFVVLRKLIGDLDHRNIWLCGTSFRFEKILLGDPACDRIVFDPPAFETVIVEPTVVLKWRYMFEVSRAASTLSEEDVLVLVLVGHGDPNDVFKIGDEDHDSSLYDLTKAEVEHALGDTKASVWLISRACYSGAWESPKWTLLAAAEADEEASSSAVSVSKKVRGGFFANALLAQLADEFKLNAPCPASVDKNGICGQRQSKDFGSGKFVQCPSFNLSCETQSFSAESAHATDGGKQVGLSSPHLSASIEPAKLSTENEKLLVSLAKDLLQFKPIQTARETATIVMCHRVLSDNNPLNNTEKGCLLSVLKDRKQYQELAVAIAESLGWGKLVDKLGRPDGEQARLSSMFGLQWKAEASGCLVNVLIQRHTLGRYSGAAGWLARIWEAAGSPRILSQDWELSVKQSRIKLGSEF